MRNHLLVSFLLLFSVPVTTNSFAASSTTIPLQTAAVSIHDKAALQRGARNFMNYCSGCHALHLVSYQHIADGIGLSKENNDVFIESIIYPIGEDGERYKMGNYVTSGFSKKYSTAVYGTQVPDLSLIDRVRGKDWLYTYLISFYQDESRPTGFNNLVFKDVAMPNPFWEIQGIQTLKEEYSSFSNLHLARQPFDLKTEGILTEKEFKLFVRDIVSFLIYVSDPSAAIRKNIGYWVVSFMLLLTILTYLLHIAFWRDVETGNLPEPYIEEK